MCILPTTTPTPRRQHPTARKAEKEEEETGDKRGEREGEIKSVAP